MSANKNAPKKVARNDLTRTLILHSPSGRELFHYPLLFFRQFLRRFDLHFDNQVSVIGAFLNSLPAHPETFPGGSAGRNSYHDFLSIESINTDLGAKCRLRDVERQRRDHIEPFALIELVGHDVERNEQVTRRSVRRAFTA